MISGTFHVTAQEWRYYSREKSLIHTLHLAQLPSGTVGNSVFILAVPPTGSLTAGGFGIGTGIVPAITPYRNLSFAGTTGYMVSPWFVGNLFGTHNAFPGLFDSATMDASAEGYSNGADFAWWASLSGTCPPQGDPGGMIWMAYGHPLDFSIDFGGVPQPAPESVQEYAFIADILPRSQFQINEHWPPPNLQQLSHGDQFMSENGNKWQTNLETVQMAGGYVQPTDHQILVDNVSFPHGNVNGKGVGSASWIGLAPTPNTYTATNYNLGVKFGPMNLLNGPNWYGQ